MLVSSKSLHRHHNKSLDKLVIISTHDESPGVVLCALGRVHAAAVAVLVNVDDISSLAILNRKLELLLLLLDLIHWAAIHRVISEGQGLGLGQLRWARVEAISQLSAFLAQFLPA